MLMQGYPTALLPWDREDAVELYFVNRVKEATFIKVRLLQQVYLSFHSCTDRSSSFELTLSSTLARPADC